MCDPFSAAGLALSAGAGVMRARQNQEYVDEVNAQNQAAYDRSKKAREDEQARQQQFQAEATKGWQDTATALSAPNFDQAATDAQQTFMSDFGNMPSSMASEGFLLGGQEGASDEVKQVIASEANRTAADARKRVQALAALSSFDTVGRNRAASIGQNADALQLLNGLRRGSLGVATQEQTIPAATVTPGSSLLPDILSGAGGVMPYAGGMFQQAAAPQTLY